VKDAGKTFLVFLDGQQATAKLRQTALTKKIFAAHRLVKHKMAKQACG